MHRVFIHDSTTIVRQLLAWFRQEPKHRDRVARIMLIWLNNHFEDFEGETANRQMIGLLDEFDEVKHNYVSSGLIILNSDAGKCKNV